MVVGQQVSDEAAQVLGDALDPGSRPVSQVFHVSPKARVGGTEPGDGLIPAAG
jgi:hypothetical protein